MMRFAVSVGVLVLLMTVRSMVCGQEGGKKQDGRAKVDVSFHKDVFPIVNKSCLPCHAEDSFNPSELSLDSYETLMEGGKHGRAVLPGKSKESILIQKLGSKPPFGDPMPLNPKRKKGELSMRRLSEAEIRTIAEWIDQGAKDN